MSKFLPISILARASFILLLLWLAGCSTFFGKHGVFRGRGSDYLGSGPIKKIELPEGMESVSIEPMYQVPGVSAVDEFGDTVTLEEYKVPRPLPMGDKSEVGVKIQKLGGKRWIYLNASTAQVWPRTQFFLAETEVDVAVSNATAGLILTDWLEFSDDADNAVRFRIRLEKGIHPDTTEIHITHMTRPQSMFKEGLVELPWPQTSDDPEREAWMLKELANSLALTVDNNAASLLGQNVGGDLKAGFTRFDGEPTLQLRLPNKRAWATVSHASDREGFKIWEDRVNEGLLYVGYAPYDEDGEGFFSKLAFWSDGEALPNKAPYSMEQLLSNLKNSATVKARFSEIPGVKFSAESLKDPMGYLIVLHEQGEYVLVNIRDTRGERLPDAHAKEFLRLLRKNLI